MERRSFSPENLPLAPKSNERQTATPEVAFRLAEGLTAVLDLLPALSYEIADPEELALPIEQLDHLIAEVQEAGEDKEQLLPIYRDIRERLVAAQAHLPLGYRDSTDAAGQAIKTFESYFATHVLCRNVTELLRYAPKVPPAIAKRISGCSLGEHNKRLYFAAKEKKGSTFPTIIAHEDRHVWNKLFDPLWQDKTAAGLPSAKAARPDLAPESVRDRVDWQRFSWSEFVAFYQANVQNYIRNELTAFFAEGADRAAVLNRFLGSYFEDNYDFTEMALYRVLGFYAPESSFGPNRKDPDFVAHYREFMTTAVDVYFDVLEAWKTQFPDQPEPALRNRIANYLMFAHLKDLPQFAERLIAPQAAV